MDLFFSKIYKHISKPTSYFYFSLAFWAGALIRGFSSVAAALCPFSDCVDVCDSSFWN
jgi:hypothetical protein